MTEQNATAKVDHDIIYSLRTAHQNQTQLNLMADQKANILVGTIVILLTFLFTRFPQSLLDDRQIMTMVSVFVVLEIIAVIIGIMVIKPRTRWRNSDMKIEEMPNPLFFGFFTLFKEKDYSEYMLRQLQNNHDARAMLIKDIYQIGQVLKRKYALLKYAYNFAAAGIIFSVFAIGFIQVLKFI